MNGDVSHSEDMSADLTVSVGDEDSAPSSSVSPSSETQAMSASAIVVSTDGQPEADTEQATYDVEEEDKPTFQSDLSVITPTVSDTAAAAEQQVHESSVSPPQTLTTNNVTNSEESDGEGEGNPSLSITAAHDSSSLLALPQQIQVTDPSSGDESPDTVVSAYVEHTNNVQAELQQQHNVELTVDTTVASEPVVEAETASPGPLTIGAAASEPSIQIASSSSAEQTDNSTHSLPTSPKSPTTKKKNFWQKLARIFKPWKWRRKKRSKKLELQAVGE